MSSHRSLKTPKLKLSPMAKRAEDDKVSFGCSLSPRCMSKRFSAFAYDSDEEDRCTSPTDVPEGYMAVYVGRERKRFVIPTSYLSLPVFRTLLDRAEEEFGFVHKGGLTLPCDVKLFKQVLQVLKRRDSAQQQMSMADILNVIAREKEPAAGREALQYSTKSFRPLFRASLQKSFG